MTKTRNELIAAAHTMLAGDEPDVLERIIDMVLTDCAERLEQYATILPAANRDKLIEALQKEAKLLRNESAQ